MSDNHERADDPYTLNIGPGPFPLSIHHDPFRPYKPRSGKPVEQVAPRSRVRRIVRALPSPSNVALIGLVVAVLANPSNTLLRYVAVAYAVYVCVTNEIRSVFDPGCVNPAHQHDDCPACADLEPLTVRALVGRERPTR